MPDRLTTLLPPRAARSGDRVALWLWVAFVVYGSLVPLDFRPLSFDQAWTRFQSIRFLDLGLAQRADWIANGLLYIPVGALVALVLTPARASPVWRAVAAILATILAAALALGVEFTQVFFPQRTVSLNDVMAEALGGVAGAAIGAFWLPQHWPRAGWWQRLALGGTRMAWLYGTALVLLAMFPFDLLLSPQEWQDRLAGEGVAWWLANDSEGRNRLRLMVGLAVEAASMLPLAWAVARRGGPESWRWVQGLGLGLALGMAIELAQLGVASAVSQGASVLTRGAGMALGVLLVQRARGITTGELSERVRRASGLAWPLYLLLLAALAGWFDGPWRSPQEALARLQTEVRFVPFYYHYFVSEVRAMASLTGVAVMYSPVALWVWSRRGGAGHAGLLAALICAVIEAGKLFAEGSRPDPTNLLVAAAAAAVLAAWLDWTAPAEASGSAASGGSVRAAPLPPSAWAVLAAAGVVWTVSGPWAFPVATTAGLFGAMAVVWWRPAAAAGLALGLVLVADPRPWSGILLVSEVDTAMAALLAVAWWRSARLPALAPPDRVLRWVLLAILASMVLGVGRSMINWWSSPVPFWTVPGGFWRPMLVAKGVLWGTLVVALAHEQTRRGLALARPTAWGLGVGLAGTALWMGWEWLAFTVGPSPSPTFRPSGPLADMATGGAANEAVLLLTLPWLAAALWMARSWPVRAGLLLAGLGGVWAILLTQTRSAHVALALGLALAAVMAMERRLPSRVEATRSWLRWVGGAAAVSLLAVGAWVGLVTLAGPVAEHRISRAPGEIPNRLATLAEAVALHDGRWSSVLWGMGWAGFASRHYWSVEPKQRVSSLSVDAGQKPPSLQLGAGLPTYVDQVLRPGDATQLDMRVRWRVRPDSKEGGLAVLVCRKWHLNSRACVGQSLATSAEPGQWQLDRFSLDIAGVVDAHGLAAAPLSLSVYNRGGAPLELQTVQVLDASGASRLAATGFERGLQRWAFTSDEHLSWHLKSLPLGLLWKRGLLGTAAVAALLLLVLHRARATAASPQDPPELQALRWMAPATVLMSLVIGAFDMPLDSPRYQMVWLASFGVLAALMRPRVTLAPTA